MELCKNCGRVLLEEDGQLIHMYPRKCKEPVVQDLIGLHFMDGYFEFEVVKRHLDDDKFYCDGRGQNNLRKRVYEKAYIINNAIT